MTLTPVRCVWLIGCLRSGAMRVFVLSRYRIVTYDTNVQVRDLLPWQSDTFSIRFGVILGVVRPLYIMGTPSELREETLPVSLLANWRT